MGRRWIWRGLGWRLRSRLRERWRSRMQTMYVSTVQPLSCSPRFLSIPVNVPIFLSINSLFLMYPYSWHLSLHCTFVNTLSSVPVPTLSLRHDFVSELYCVIVCSHCPNILVSLKFQPRSALHVNGLNRNGSNFHSLDQLESTHLVLFRSILLFEGANYKHCSLNRLQQGIVTFTFCI